MRAIAYTNYGAPDVLQVVEVPTPVPRDNEVLIRNHAVVVSSVDCTFRAGSPFYSRVATGLTKPKNPVLGGDVAGEIVAVGSNVTRFSAGDQVFAVTGPTFGGYAEYVCLPEDGALAIKPANVSYADVAAASAGSLTALPFLRDAGKIRSGQRVLINGASGTVGTAAVQLAKHFGAEVTGVCGTRSLELVRALGADRVIDYTRDDFTADGQTYDIIFDAAGKSSYRRSGHALTPSGIYLTTVPSLAIMPQMLWTSRFGDRRAIIAFNGLRSASEKARDLQLVRDLMQDRKLRGAICQDFPFEQTADAHRFIEQGHKQGNVVITFDQRVDF